MSQTSQFKFSPWILAVPLYLVVFLWLVYWFEVKFGYNFNKFGIFPRTFSGLKGILFSPFIHGDIKHLYHNSAPLFVLLFSLLYFYKDIAWKVFIYGTLLTGLLTWIIARKSYHIGASGIIYLLFSFIFFSGVIRKNYRLIAVSLMVIFLYGSMVWYLLPVKESVSWEGHLSGFLIGLSFAVFYRNYGPQRFQYEWEKENYEPDEFDNLFEEREEMLRNSNENTNKEGF
ncbi:rhomboid family intramembrane serine protease [Lutimonas zeaxanthinifaciens]|uniref:rhomboid family intramembrane serine protease n=1 Tax=Lutimonas zeaxanthinifaciens TaxID=3060215 RepID=UPI00265D09EB|nr:rhomboid family intramembrane serine protease [Lutimonas sp. YSD2104]WKK66779.1 rhomboid family intramembrane serine protease [Lutimonas sp. YSD2104]